VIVWVVAEHVGPAMPPQFELPMQGLRMLPGFVQEQVVPEAESSQLPGLTPHSPTRQLTPPQVHEPVVPVRRASAIAVMVTGSEHVTPVVSRDPESTRVVHPVASSVDRHVFQLVHCVVGVTPEVKLSE
jgi:hypothetical protein